MTPVNVVLWYCVRITHRNSWKWVLQSGEQQSTLMCSTNHIFLEWNVSSLGHTETRSISNLDQNVVVSPIIMMDSAKFTFSRVSSPRALPLVSTMMILNVTSNLEGTVISCYSTGQNSSSVSSVVLMTTVHIYDMDVGRSRIWSGSIGLSLWHIYCKYYIIQTF